MSNRGLRRLLLLAGLVAVLWAYPIVAVQADDCGTPFDCEETGGFIGITSVVGGIAAVAAAAAAAVTATNGADGEAEEQELAIIQVTSDRIEVDIENPGSFRVQAWLSSTSKGTVQAPDIPLGIEVPHTPGLIVFPTAGAGSLDVEVTVDDTAEESEVVIVVTGSYKGRVSRQPVTVVIGGGYVLEIY